MKDKPAFSREGKHIRIDENSGTFVEEQVGLTRRELFAAMALQGYLASNTRLRTNYVEDAEDAVASADALIKELEK